MALKSEHYNPELTLPDILKRAASTPGAFIGFIDEKGLEDKITYADLLLESTRLAVGLVNKGVKSGDKVIIATDTNKQTLKLLWGCVFMWCCSDSPSTTSHFFRLQSTCCKTD